MCFYVARPRLRRLLRCIILRGELLHHDWKFRPTFYDGVFLLAGWEVKFSGPITWNARTRLGEESGKGRKMGTQFRGATRGRRGGWIGRGWRAGGGLRASRER